jgi:hypothetical protein
MTVAVTIDDHFTDVNLDVRHGGYRVGPERVQQRVSSVVNVAFWLGSEVSWTLILVRSSPSSRHAKGDVRFPRFLVSY